MTQREKRSAIFKPSSIFLLVQCIFLTQQVVADDDECKFKNHNLADLGKFDPWVTFNDNLNATFHINLCGKLENALSLGCPETSSVCAKYSNGTVVDYGNFHDENSTDDNANGELLIMSSGESCPGFAGYNYVSVIYFKCGKTLGHPYFIGDMSCTSHFEWESYIFCEDVKSSEKEVPCTVMKDGHLIDLSPLTKLIGGHLVDRKENQGRKVYINVCRDIKPGKDSSQYCPPGAAACRVLVNTGVNFGELTRRLEATTMGVRLVYEASVDGEGCTGKPKTIINFECPERGGSKDPVLVSDFLCNYVIHWVTEYACPLEHITSKTCQLTSAQHDVDIDLSPLRRIPLKDAPHLVTVADKDVNYRYYINICGDLGYECGNATHSSVCQKKVGSSTFAHDLGHRGSLTYSDGELVMKLKDGDSCLSKFRRMTLIKFICNETAENNGEGNPVYEAEEGCTYTFSWATKYACVNHILGDSCRVDADGKRYDLSSLVKTQDKNWEVLVGDNEKDESFFLNVCHDVLSEGIASKCPPGAAMCTVNENGIGKSLGKYTTALEYHGASNSLRLAYTRGDKTVDGCVRTTTINFFCLPGVLDSAPKLVHVSEDGCYHELEWHTAAACALSHKNGVDCKVVDINAGYHFDLTPLKKSDGSYSATFGGYTYYLNVCDIVHGNAICDTQPHDNAAVCQVKDSDKSQVKIAGPLSVIEYFDGVLNLTYVNGEQYHNADKTRRQAEIAFLCDLKAGVGSPEFLIEKDYTYAFEWRTSYACPATPVECLTTDPATGKQFDLSSLLKATEYWEIIDDSVPGKKVKFYINVCQPVAKVKGDHCSSFSAACATHIEKDGTEKLFHGNLGRAESPPEYENATNGLRLVYTNGNDCSNNGKMEKFKTSIHFVCVHGKETGLPLTPKLIKPCEYSLVWETAAACPLNDKDKKTPDDSGKKTETLPCSLKDANSGFTFNFMPLLKHDGNYEVKSTDGSKTYKLNICGAVADDVCGKFEGPHGTSVCEGSSPVATTSTDITSSGAGEMTLVYKGKDDQTTGERKHYTLSFFCRRTAQTPEIVFDRAETFYTYFRVYTALACPPEPVECEAFDVKGRKYDLSLLSREEKNWVVIDTRPTHSNLHYHINVCRPVIATAGMTCRGGAVGACQTGDQGYNMGYVQSKPVASEDGKEVTILYQGGDKCHLGKDTESTRSTRITFVCSGVEHGPVFESESAMCEYRFVWQTPSACPQHLVTGSECKVKEPLYDFEFDLSALHKSITNYKVAANGYEFLINVCGPLVATDLCNGLLKVGSCQTGQSLLHPMEAGVANDRLMYNAGELSLEYTDGKGNCHHKYNRSTIIEFVCDHSKKAGTSEPKYVEEKSDCTYMFEWSTSLACPPHKVIDCTFEHGNDIYDLSRLSLADSNYERLYNVSNKQYILNVCRSLVHTKGQTCPFNSAACEIDLSETDEKKRYHNMGMVDSLDVSFNDNNILVMTYSNGDLCADGKTHRSTKIYFTCDTNSDALGIPHSHFQTDGCTDSFQWTSSAACPLIKKDDKDTTTHPGNCKVKNPQTGYEFDLSSLASTSGKKTYDRAGSMFELNVCAPLANHKDCPEGTGSCKTLLLDGVKGVSAGKANGDLQYRDGVLVLEYKEGDACFGGDSRSATFINFVCSPKAGKGVPVFVDKSGDCEYYFDWHTDLACETQIECSVKTDKGAVLDFSPLVHRSGKYNVLSNVGEDSRVSGMIYLNLCRPLNPVFGTLCPAGSGACLVREGAGNKPLSLGHVHDPMNYDPITKSVKLTYVHGDVCPSNPKVNMSSMVILKCFHEEKMDPELDSVTADCRYIFTFLTPLACEETGPSTFSKTCQYHDRTTDTTFDLSSLSDALTVKNEKGSSFSIKPCGHLVDKGEAGEASCADASVCVEKAGGFQPGSYGRFDKATARKNYYTLDIEYTEGRSCTVAGKTSKAATTIMFKCDPTAGTGSPRILESSECHVSFLWETSLVCPKKRKECTVGDGGALFDFNVLSQDSGSWNHTDADKNVYWINLCQSVHGPTISPTCPKNAAVCMKTKSGETFMLGDVDTQEIKVESHSGDSSSILMKYTQGDTSVCSKGRRRRSDLQPTVSIHLKCATTLGAPVLMKHQSDSDCVFEFEWNTRIACQVGRNPKEVSVKEGKILDPRSGRTLDLSSLLQGSVHPSFSVGGKTYSVNLMGQLPLDASDDASHVCQGAALCQQSDTTHKYRNLGSSSHRSYYIKDEKVEAIFTSPNKCTGKQKDRNVTSTVLFNCDKHADKETVELLYHTSDCDYIFSWSTKTVCLEAATSSESGKKTSDADSTAAHGGDGKSGAGGSGASKVAVGVTVVTSIVVICILILVLHRPERRAAIKSKMKTFLFCRKNTDSIVYSKLSASADDTEFTLDDDPFNPFNEPDEEAEIINGQLPVQVHAFHDDSDEDLLL